MTRAPILIRSAPITGGRVWHWHCTRHQRTRGGYATQPDALTAALAHCSAAANWPTRAPDHPTGRADPTRRYPARATPTRGDPHPDRRH